MEVENKENDENLDMQNMPTMENTGSLSEQPIEDQPIEAEAEAEQSTEEQPVEEQPVEESVEEQPVEEQPVEEQSVEESVEESEAEQQPVEEEIKEQPRQLERAESILKEAGNFRKKLKTLKKRLPLLDDDEKDQIRNGVIREFINVLKISKPEHTRKRFGRRINNLRNIFHDSLNVLNGTAKKHPRRKSRKQKVEEPIPEESTTFSESQL
jgi:hypothetical protein